MARVSGLQIPLPASAVLSLRAVRLARPSFSRDSEDGLSPRSPKKNSGRPGNMAGGLYLLTPARGAPSACTGPPPLSAELLAPLRGHKRPPQENGGTPREVSSPGIGVDTANTRDRHHRAPPRRRPPLPAVRPAGPGGWRRPGRLHAPEAARTGPVSASRRSHVLMPRGGAGSTGKWPLTGFLAGASVNWAWAVIPTDL